MSLETWAVAAVAIVDVEGSPLLLRTYTSPKDVLNSSAAPLHAHLYVGPEDIIKLHFVLFASLDRCDELREAAAQLRDNTAGDEAESSPLSIMGQPGLAHASASPKVPAGNSGGCTNPGAGNENTSTVARLSPAPSGGGAGGTSSSAPSATATANNSMTSTSVNASTRFISPTTDARFLGKLLESHRMRSYGFCSATGIRTLLVTVGSDAPADAMVPLCRALYESASAALCNPFRSPAQCYHAQEQLLYMSSLTDRSDRAGAAVGDAGAATAASVGAMMANSSMTAGSINRLHLPPGAVEWSWPRAAPTSVAALTAEPTLALSRTFNAQMESLLSSFTVTARSCIVR